MSNIFQKSLDTAKEGFHSLKNMKQDKRAYKEFLKRIQLLPDDYMFVYEKIANYMWSSSGGGNGYDMISLQSDLLELFEASVADGKQVFEVTGEDVAAFCDELLRNAKTYMGNRREKMNDDILKKLKNKRPE